MAELIELDGYTILSEVVGEGGGGKGASGAVRVFYSYKETETACADLLRGNPRANAEGLFEAEGECWGTTTALERKLGLRWPTIKKRLPSSCRTLEGKNASGMPCVFYALKDVEAACVELLKERKAKT